jgi:putative methyltransferase (TIGR04325 family)
MVDAKTILRELTPPILWRSARRFLGPATTHRAFEGPFPSWADAVAGADSWDSPIILERTLAAALQVRDGAAAFEQDGIPHDTISYSPTILAFLLLAKARYSRLEVIDFGGGLGSNYFQNLRLLRSLSNTPRRWNIVERNDMTKLGAEHFQTDELRFGASLATALHAGAVLLFSGSLQYVAKPFDLLKEAISSTDIIALDRVIVSPIATDAVFIQHPNPLTYGRATYPVWCFSKDALIDWFVARGFVLVDHFTHDPRRHFDICGMLFQRPS